MVEYSSHHDALSRVGIRQWYVKYALPNAAESPIFLPPVSEFTKPSSVVLSSASLPVQKLSMDNLSSVSPPDGLVVTNNVEHLIGDLIANDDNSGERLPVNDSKVISVVDNFSVQDGLKLSLSVVRYDQYLVVYELDELDSKGLEGVLLSAIMQPVDRNTINAREGLPLSWPAFQSEALFRGQTVFFDPVFRRWLECQDWSGCRCLLYFGKCFDNLESIFLSLKGVQESNCSVLPFRFSLSQLLASPIKKKKLWELFSGVGGVGG